MVRWQNLLTKYYYKSFYYFCNFSEGAALPARDRNLCMRRQCNNLLKLHCHREQTIARVPGLKTSAIFLAGGGRQNPEIFFGYPNLNGMN